MRLALRAERRRNGLPPPRSNVLESSAWVTASDGARLATRILRPADAQLRRGTVLVRTERPLGSRSPLEKLAFWLAEDGRNVVLQSCRGRDASEGDFEPFVAEESDGAAALRWIGEQPELAGPTVLIGFGYAAFTAWAAAAAAPERVSALATGFGARDPWDWLHTGGVLQLEAALALAARLEGRRGIEPDALDLDRAGRHRALAECDRVAVRELSAFRAWRAHPERDAWWEARTPSLASVPRTLFVGGWYDCALRASLADYAVLAQREAPTDGAAPVLLLGPWGAAPPPRGLRSRSARPLAAVVGAVSQFVARVAGESKAREIATRVFVLGTGWRDARPWPPPRVVSRALYLHSGGRANSLEGDGRLSAEPPGEEPADTFVSDPADPVPSCGGAAWRGIAGPVDQRPVERRGDVLCFTGEPLERALELAGHVALILYVESDAESFNTSAKLVAVAPDGSARWLGEGIARRRADTRDSALRIELGAMGARLSAGTRLRLEVAGSSLPRFARGGEDDRGPDRRRVHHDPSRPSALHLEVSEH